VTATVYPVMLAQSHRSILILRKDMMKHLKLCYHSLQSTILRLYLLNDKYCEDTGRDCAWHSGKSLA